LTHIGKNPARCVQSTISLSPSPLIMEEIERDGEEICEILGIMKNGAVKIDDP
jgi:hypothetical protein